MQKLTIIVLLAAYHQACVAHVGIKPTFFGLGKRRVTSNAIPKSFVTSTNLEQRKGESSSEVTSSKVGELIPTFEELISSSSSGSTNSDVHVGKLLTAMKQMERHMRNVGMKQGANDLAGNIDKVEQLYVRAPADKRDSMSDLLKWEIETGGIHGSPTPTKLPEKSAAMGLSWLGHNIRYQYTLYKQMLENGGCDPVHAATHAFQQHIRPHLSRTVSMVAQATIPKVVPRTQSEFFSTLGGCGDTYGPREDAAIRRDIHAMLGTWEPLLEDWSSVFDDLSLGAV